MPVRIRVMPARNSVWSSWWRSWSAVARVRGGCRGRVVARRGGPVRRGHPAPGDGEGGGWWVVVRGRAGVDGVDHRGADPAGPASPARPARWAPVGLCFGAEVPRGLVAMFTGQGWVRLVRGQGARSWIWVRVGVPWKVRRWWVWWAGVVMAKGRVWWGQGKVWSVRWSRVVQVVPSVEASRVQAVGAVAGSGEVRV